MVNHAFTHKLGMLLRNVDNQMARDALERRAILHYIQGDRIPDILEMIRASSIYANAHV